MSSFSIQKGGTMVAVGSPKAWTVGTGSIFRITGPVAVHAIFGRNTIAFPSADIVIRLQFSSSYSGLTYLSADSNTFFTAYAVGSYNIAPTTISGSITFNLSGQSETGMSPWYVGPGEVQFLANDATPATLWHMFYTPLHLTSSVIPL